VDGEDLADDTFIAVSPSVVTRAVHNPGRWWPGLGHTVALDRGLEGLHWEVSGALRGTAEIWLEPYGDGTVVHFYLRAALSDRARGERTREWKRAVHALKDELEGDRPPGTPAAPQARSRLRR
jgi:hypothetical protein